MITVFRRMLDTWVARGFFLIMVLSFVSWGVGDVIRLIGTSTWVAKVGGQTIEGAQLQEAYQREMSQATRDLPSGQEPSQEMRSGVAREALQRLIGQAALNQELQRLRIVTPDAAVRQSVFAMPAFHGPNGQFDRQTFEAVLRNNGLTEARFLDMMRGELAQRQLLGAVSAGATTPEALLRPLFQGRFEKRSADMVEFPLAAAPEPPAPTEADLQRWYDNHPGQIFRTGIPQDQGGRAVAADIGEGHPGHRRRPAGGVSAAQGRLREAGKAVCRSGLRRRRGQGQGARR